MSTSISLTYLPGVSRSDFAAGITASEIFRKTLQLLHSRTFQISAEAVAVLSVFTAVAVWVFALTPGIAGGN